MAVYTKITLKLLKRLLKNYKLGILDDFHAIQEGVENTNYQIITSKGKFILTIFEKRVRDKDLPFFINLTKSLNNKGFKCPQPILDNNKKYINKILNKKCIITSFLNGKKIIKINNIHCNEIGKQLSRLHFLSKNIKLYRKNNFGKSYWKKIFLNFSKTKKNPYNKIFEEIKIELFFLNKNWPKNLPSGIIHADVFKDNVFFIKNNFSGLIDFYFSCNDYFAYELAICINAWCFDSKFNLNKSKAKKLISAYQKYRKLNSREKKAFSILLRGAAMRFLLTRLNDIIYQPKNALVAPHDPFEYYNILKYHQKNDITSSIII